MHNVLYVGTQWLTSRELWKSQEEVMDGLGNSKFSNTDWRVGRGDRSGGGNNLTRTQEQNIYQFFKFIFVLMYIHQLNL